MNSLILDIYQNSNKSISNFLNDHSLNARQRQFLILINNEDNHSLCKHLCRHLDINCLVKKGYLTNEQAKSFVDSKQKVDSTNEQTLNKRLTLCLDDLPIK